MPIFPTARELRAIMAPVTADAATQVGSRVTIVRKVTAHAADRSVRITWQPVVGLDRVAIRIAPVTTERLRTIWGVDAQVHTDGTCSDTVSLKSGDGILVVSGNYTGEQFVIGQTIANPLAGALYLVLDPPTEPITVAP